jgi:hypothetical protein
MPPFLHMDKLAVEKHILWKAMNEKWREEKIVFLTSSITPGNEKKELPKRV